MSSLKEINSHRKSQSHSVDYRKPSVTTVLPDGDVPNFEGLSADEAALTALGVIIPLSSPYLSIFFSVIFSINLRVYESQ